MALALAHEGFSVALIDPRASTSRPAQDDERTTAIAFASARLFKRLGVWDPLDAGACPINDILVTNGTPRDAFRDGGVDGQSLHFPSTLLPEERGGGEDGTALGYIVGNKAMAEAFEAAVQAAPLITSLYGVGMIGSETMPGARQLRLDNDKTLSVRLLVACDGKHSTIRRQEGLRALSWPYAQKALVFNIAHEKPHHGVAHELFCPSGPFAILPMTDNRCSIVWTEHKRSADAYLALPENEFLSAVEDRVGPSLGQLSLASDPVAWPLSFHYVPNPVGERLVMAGDAAHTIHPIAGQGFNLGIKDIAALADVAGEAMRTGLDVGHGSTLERYAKWRQFDTASLALGTDVMNRLFSNDIAPIRWARSAGLGLVQKMDPARIFFMRHAGADVGDLPSLMRPF